MPRRNAVSFNLLIDAYSRDSQPDAALQTFQRARRAVKADRFTYAAALAACSRGPRPRQGRAVHALAVLEGLAGGGVFVSNSLLSMYAGCGDMGVARRVFDAAVVHDDVSWNSLLSGYVRAGTGAREEVLRVFALMRRCGMGLNSFALGSVVKCCSGSGGDSSVRRRRFMGVW
jgi:pentatricopeptide repeat protein